MVDGIDDEVMGLLHMSCVLEGAIPRLWSFSLAASLHQQFTTDVLDYQERSIMHHGIGSKEVGHTRERFKKRGANAGYHVARWRSSIC